MKILIATAVYPPEPVVAARMSADLREYLTARGHEVTVICPWPSRGIGHDNGERVVGVLGIHAVGETGTKQSVMSEGAGRKSVGRRGGEVVRVDSYRCVDSRLWGRARESWSFGRWVARWLSAQPECFDVIYADPWPLFAPRHIVRAAGRQRVPLVLHIQDVYPESLSTKLPGGGYWLAALPLLALDRWIVRRCARVVLPSERLAQAYGRTRRIAERVRVVRNWQDESLFAVAHDRAAVCAEYDVPADRFTFLYLGNLSALAGLETVIRAFARVARSDRQLVLVGEGSAKPTCQRLVRELGLTNVLFRSEPDPTKVARVQTMADVCMLPTRRAAARSSTPSKCIAYMLSGKPILAVVDADSDTAEDIRRADCGWICEPEAEAPLARWLEHCAGTVPEERELRGNRGREYARARFGRAVGMELLAEIIREAAGPGGGRQ